MAQNSRKIRMRARMLGGGVMLLALALGGCESNGGPVIGGSITTVSASRTAPVAVFISPTLSGSAAFVAGLPPIFDLRIAASTTVDLDQITIHMIDGTNLGGPMVTVPRADLVGQFGNILILGGRRERSVASQVRVDESSAIGRGRITVRDSRGVAFSVTAVSPCHRLHRRDGPQLYEAIRRNHRPVCRPRGGPGGPDTDAEVPASP